MGKVITESYWKDGVFYPDQTPVEMPLGYEEPESLQEMVARMVRSLHDEKGEQEFDTIDDCEDFDVMDDDIQPPSNHEYTEMQEEHVRVERGKRKSELEEAERVAAEPDSETKKSVSKQADVVDSPKGGQ